MAVLTLFNEDETCHKQNITGYAKTADLIHKMDDVKNFILQTNYVEPVQVEGFYVKIFLQSRPVNTTLTCL